MMLLEKKSFNAFLLATLGSGNNDNGFHSRAAAQDIGSRQDTLGNVASYVAESFHLGDSSRTSGGKKSKSVDAKGKWEGLECVPEAKKKLLERLHRRSKRLLMKANSSGPDVGVLSTGLAVSSCPAPGYVCQLDSSSFLGGRCIQNGSSLSSTFKETPVSILGSHRLLQEVEECPAACNEAFCNCFLLPTDEASVDSMCLSAAASTCNNSDELQSCATTFAPLEALETSCDVLTCLNDGGGNECYYNFSYGYGGERSPTSATADTSASVSTFACANTCANDVFCGCLEEKYYGFGVCQSVFESMCQDNEELSNCIDDPFSFNQFKYFQCPAILCYGSGGSYQTGGSAACTCEIYSSICDFCSSSKGALSPSCYYGIDSTCTSASCCSTSVDSREKEACFSQGSTGVGTVPTGSSSYGGNAIECKDTCTNDAVCSCLQDASGPACLDVAISACQNDMELSSCLDSFWFTQTKYFMCPFLLCYGTGKGYDECQCEQNRSNCDFCSSPEGVGTYNCACSEGMCTAASCCDSASNDVERSACLATWKCSDSSTAEANGSTSTTTVTSATTLGTATTTTNEEPTSIITEGPMATTTAPATTTEAATTESATTSAATTITTTAGTTPALSSSSQTSTTQSSTTSPNSSGGDFNTENEVLSSEGNVDVATATQENGNKGIAYSAFGLMSLMLTSAVILNALN